MPPKAKVEEKVELPVLGRFSSHLKVDGKKGGRRGGGEIGRRLLTGKGDLPWARFPPPHPSPLSAPLLASRIAFDPRRGPARARVLGAAARRIGAGSRHRSLPHTIPRSAAAAAAASFVAWGYRLPAPIARLTSDAPRAVDARYRIALP